MINELIQMENELQDDEVSVSSLCSSDSQCLLATKIINAMAKGKTQKNVRKPWMGPPRTSPPKTPGDAVLKNKIIRSRGQSIPVSFKMALPSMNTDSIISLNRLLALNQSRIAKEWPTLSKVQRSTVNLSPTVSLVSKSKK
jgi:hypothetical protein